jgi:hypothetical protein
MGGAGLIDLVGGGNSLVVGTVAADGEPRAIRAWAARVVDERTRRVRVVMGADDEVSVDNLRNGRLALTGADVRTLRSVQLKGRVVRTEPATDADVQLVAEHSSAFFRAVHETDGIALELLDRLLPAAIVAVEFEVDEMFDQSPGPDAGAAVDE